MKIFNLDEDSLLEEAESAALTAEMDSVTLQIFENNSFKTLFICCVFLNEEST